MAPLPLGGGGGGGGGGNMEVMHRSTVERPGFSNPILFIYLDVENRTCSYIDIIKC